MVQTVEQGVQVGARECGGRTGEEEMRAAGGEE